MPDLLYIDLETFNARHDVTHVGVDVYCRSSEPLIAAYAMNDDPVSVWEYDQDPSEVIQLLSEADSLIAHNAWFEHNNLAAWGWCDRPVDAWHCTMAQALVHCMPAGLDALGRFIGLPQKDLKLGGGKELMRLFCKPQRDGRRLRREDRQEEWQKFIDYAVNDVVAMREIHKRLPRVNLHE